MLHDGTYYLWVLEIKSASRHAIEARNLNWIPYFGKNLCTLGLTITLQVNNELGRMFVKRRHGQIWNTMAALSGRKGRWKKITKNISHDSQASWPMYEKGTYWIRSKTANHSTVIFSLERLTSRKSLRSHTQQLQYLPYESNHILQSPGDQTT
jgi:hypothetical protein